MGDTIHPDPALNTLHTYTRIHQWEGRKLTEWINTAHENPKYLPGVILPDNVVACPDLAEAARDASVLVFVLPHQFLRKRACVESSFIHSGICLVCLSLNMED